MADERLEHEDDAFVREQLTPAGRRPPIPAGEMEHIKEAARPVWKQRYCRRDTSNWRRWALPAAAVLAIGVLLVWLLPRQPAPSAPVPVARVDRVVGAVTTSDDGRRDRRPVVAGSTFNIGSVLETADGAAVSVRLLGGQSLRLKPHTRVVFSAMLNVRLDEGTVYYDSLNTLPQKPMAILTDAGDFRPAGTQFEVQASRGAVELRVREGIVRFQRPSETTEARAGERLTVRNDGAIERSTVQTHGERWDWVLETAPILEIEGRPLRVFLEWVAREMGLKLEYENARTAELSDSVVLHGSIRSLEPRQALQSIAMSSGFRYRVTDGALIVAFESEEAPTKAAN